MKYPYFTFDVTPVESGDWEIRVQTYSHVGSYPFHPDTQTIKCVDPTDLVEKVTRLSARMGLGKESS